MDLRMRRMKQLINMLNIARDNYYNGNETMTNYEYDKLFDELSDLEKDLGVLMNNSPTQSVGYEVKSELNKVKHKDKLLSLDKTKSVDDLYKFMGDQPCLLMHKLDGLTVEIKYENGELVQAQTRGNGEEGELITHNVKVFKNVPKIIPYKKTLRVVGEATIRYSVFDKINDAIVEGEKYKNPRNLTSGSVRQLDSEICSNRGVEFSAFKVNEGLENLGRMSKKEQFNELILLGFDVVEHWCINPNDKNLNEIVEYVNNMTKTVLDVPIDGLVMTYDDIIYSESLGETSHHPKHSIAFKFKDEAEFTKLKDILVDVGKSGQVSYTAVFEPVEIDGTTVEKATLHNYDYIKDLELGIGDEIGVIKANMIIPQVVENNTRSNTYSKATECPVCGSELVHEGVHQFCKNYHCERQVVGRLVHFCSRDAMDIRGMSEETIKSIMTIKDRNGNSVLSSPASIYNLPKNKEALCLLDRFGKKKVDKLCQAIEDSKTRPLNNVLYALSIPMIGRTASKEIANKYGNMDEIIKDRIVTNYQNLIGDVAGKSFTDGFFNNIQVFRTVELLKMMHGLTMTMPQEEKSDKLDGINFVLTGSVNIFKNRKELQAKIESLGGKVSGNVSKNTNYLVNNDIESSSSKNKTAKQLGVEIITEEMFVKMIE